jgi:two-component system phosphate regulon sensor histidine kinase PhoR
LSGDEEIGRTLQETIRNTALQQFVTGIMKSDRPLEDNLLLGENQDRHVQAHGTVLRGADGAAIGALVVLNDVTHLRHLEKVRQDFVANVSHELKTPITSIKGFVETLLSGALDDHKEAERFLKIVSKHANRLNAIINDLLSLSKVEQGTERSAAIDLNEGCLQSVVKAAVQLCETRADLKNVTIRTACRESVNAMINARLLEQAVVNLLDNAIKYSEDGGTVTVACSRSDHETTLSVTDEGCGIPAEHQSRLFERFYRVDKARSRELGGTGLGLSIVKHIAQSHGGRIEVQSVVGKGSVFTIYLPAGADRSRAK